MSKTVGGSQLVRRDVEVDKMAFAVIVLDYLDLKSSSRSRCRRRSRWSVVFSGQDQVKYTVGFLGPNRANQ